MNKLLASLFIMTFISSTVVASTAHHLSDDSDRKNTRNTLTLTQQYDDAYSLWHSSNPRDQDIARPALTSMAQNNSHPKQYLACYWLWRSENPDDQGIARPVFISMLKNKHHPNHYAASYWLWYSSNPRDQDIARPALTSMAQNNSHPKQYEAADSLWHSGNNRDKNIALTIIRSIRGHDVHLYDPYEFAVCLSGSDDYSSSIIASSIFRSIAQDKTHPNRHAAKKLWHSRI